MRVFVTGASGWIGSAAVAELLKAGHQVLGLARSDKSAAAIGALGAEVHRGSLDDLDSLRAGAAASDGVVHLGYSHDFSRMAEAAEMDRRALETIGATLEGTGGPLVVASGVLGQAPGRVLTEQDAADPNLHPRIAAAQAALALAERGVRSSIVRFAPTVHGPGDHGFVARLVAIARDKGVSGYIGDGANQWPAVHRFDAAKLVRLAVDGAPAGSALHAIAEEGIPTRDIAEAIGRGLKLPVVSVSAEQADEHFGWLGRFFGADSRVSNVLTRKLLGWEPTHQGLVADLKEAHYFQTQAAEIGGASLR
ncbi:MAG: 3-beta hydroxysteroid dehydrogenase [Candidatus Nephthysia bennettiae]|uniref:SDR family oxidoreductase n=1 Tax=Candidatus Nephthysia bennettiae TaxID=3127016 RepID=A0A934K307_9BACT|nr:SDR family oxidoreductase [Candidatus Dormibacteraeota bacterium]PZR95844.1 MAG: 3-beta hydroxysteroid dehydrogenase [Candidatus Dormibacteraeota bacterium]